MSRRFPKVGSWIRTVQKILGIFELCGKFECLGTSVRAYLSVSNISCFSAFLISHSPGYMDNGVQVMLPVLEMLGAITLTCLLVLSYLETRDSCPLKVMMHIFSWQLSVWNFTIWWNSKRTAVSPTFIILHGMIKISWIYLFGTLQLYP